MAQRGVTRAPRLLGLGLGEATPAHLTISRTRRPIDLETHWTVFTWILQVLAKADLIKGRRPAL